ncbi:MotA/TolQ/ExbB proton channel family protein [Hyphomonas sp. WL0036]|uniref:MotA/TolQ/ExbB proton channel family protein n=1 Tax=Hyphomonas sediminis TaxID=2866160 RepID=UPI001C7F9C8C|nr:MotA/TolQ/ExbB proton channel family protein [Hyphomonas sediminis]MBY9066878.1 MotA/TolQ/ExbB proton channel family protein [Hyphomonas sediminis]
MFKIKTPLKALGASLLIGSASLLAAQPALSQSLSDVLAAVKRDSEQMSSADAARLKEFQADTASQSARMSEARGALAAAEGRANQLSAEFNANEATLGDLEGQVSNLAGDFQELLGQFRSAAGATMPEIANSVANFDYKDRVEGIAEIAEARVLPTRAQLERLPKAMLQEMIAQSEVKTFTATVNGIGPDGSNAEAELIRIGVFTAATTNDRKFVEVRGSGSDTFLQAFTTQPAGPFASSIGSLVRAGEGQLVKAPVDPSKGNLFGILGDLPSFADRLAQGGAVGAVIAFLAIIGILIGLFKIFTLFTMGGAMRGTAKTRQAGTSNPLARVFEVYENNRNADVETLELKLDEQILRESPRIERFNDIIKVLAAIAPLMGLLGTVIGMIITFTAITIYGAGDPKLMAGGISVALMTTVFGLVAAIPLLLIHAVVSAMARGNQQLLDEQAAGLVAEKMEAAHGGRA